MKIKFLNPLLFLAIIVLTTFIGCSNEQDELSTDFNNKSQPSIGQIHNDFLTHTMRNYEFPNDAENLDTGLMDLAQFQINFLNEYSSTPFDCQEAKKGFSDFRQYYVPKNIQNVLKEGVYIKDRQYQLNELNSIYANENLISETDKKIVNDIIASLHENLNGNLSNSELYKKLLEHREYWESSQNIRGNKGSIYSYLILDISINSLEWWDKNSSEALGYQKLAPWIASDIVGAIAGAGISVGLQYFLGDSGEINWSIVAGSAIAGAVLGSTGVIGKVGKWVSSWFG